MTENDREKFATLIGALAETFGREASPATQMGYWIGVSDLTITQLKAAVTAAIRSCRFMPTPAELRELAGLPSAEDRAVLAWDVVLRNAGLGPYKSVSFADPAINATVRSLGGWPSLLARLTSADAEKWVRKEFLETYRSLARCQLDGEATLPLPGLANAEVKDGAVVGVTPRAVPVPYETPTRAERLGRAGATPPSRQFKLELRKP